MTIMTMKYVTDVTKLSNMLLEAAARAFTSEPQPYSWDKPYDGHVPSLHQFVPWTDQEKQQVKAFCASYIAVVSKIRYRNSGMFGEPDSWSAPLFTMLLHMIEDKNNCSPEYAVDNSNRLLEALETHKDAFESLELECLILVER